MGTLKIELDIPDFENTLDINISLLKDGKGRVICSTTPSTVDNKQILLTSDKKEEGKLPEPVVEEKKTSTSTRKKSGGNMMGIDF